MTEPTHRGRGLAKVVAGSVAAALLAEGHTVGLNVHAGNDAARRVYDALGFRAVHVHEDIEVGQR